MSAAEALPESHHRERLRVHAPAELALAAGRAVSLDPGLRFFDDATTRRVWLREAKRRAEGRFPR